MCMGVLDVHHMLAQCPVRPKEGVRYLKTGV